MALSSAPNRPPPIPESDARAVVVAMAQAHTPEEALALFARETERNPRDWRTESALKDAVAAYGWTLDAVPTLRAIFQIWADMAIADDVDGLALDLARLAHAKTSETANVLTRKGEPFLADAGHIDVAMLVKSASGALDTRLKAIDTRSKLREQLTRFLDRLKREGESFAGRDWDSQLRLCCAQAYEQGEIALAVALASRIRRPDTVSVKDVEPIALAARQLEHLSAASAHAAAMGDTNALVQLAPALDKAADRYTAARLGMDTSTMTDEEREAEIERMNAERAGR